MQAVCSWHGDDDDGCEPEVIKTNSLADILPFLQFSCTMMIF